MNIHVFGDSISYGMFDFQKWGWVRRLKTYLIRKGKSIRIQNHATIGMDSTSLLLQVTKEKIEKDDLVIVSIGTNDSQILNGASRTSSKDFRGNLISLAKIFGSRLVLIGLIRNNPKKEIGWWSPFKKPSYNNCSMSAYDFCIRNVSEEHSITYIPLADLFSNCPGELLCDCIHPNSTGHRVIFERIKDELEKKQLI